MTKKVSKLNLAPRLKNSDHPFVIDSSCYPTLPRVSAYKARSLDCVKAVFSHFSFNFSTTCISKVFHFGIFSIAQKFQMVSHGISPEHLFFVAGN